MPRETFILEQDIKDDQLIDTHPKPGSNLRKLVDKVVIEPLFLSGLSLSGSSTRLDFLLLDQPVSTGVGVIGIVTTQQHSLFLTGTDDAVDDGTGKEVRGSLSDIAPSFDSVAMTLGTNTGTATTPAVFGVGDIVRIQGQGTTSDYVAEISSIVGPVLTFVTPGTATPELFTQGPTASYSMERTRRWTMTWVDALGGLSPLPAASYDTGILKRIAFADLGENAGSRVPVAAEASEVPGGGGGPGVITFTATAGEFIEGNSLVYVDSDGTVKKATRAGAAKAAKVIGVTIADAASSATATIQQINKVITRLLAGLTLAAGDTIFLDTDGRGTNVPPATPTIHIVVGTVFDTTGYNGTPKAILSLGIGEPIVV